MKPTPHGTLLQEDTFDSSRSDARWKTLMELGNDAFSANNLRRAHDLYLEGLEEAERLLRLAIDEGLQEESDPVPAMIVAASNAGNVYMRQGQHENAWEVLQGTTRFLRTLIADGAAPQAVRMTCLEHIDRALAELTGHMERARATPDDIAREVADTKDAVGSCLAGLQAKSFD